MEKELLQSKRHLLHPLLRSIRKVSRKLLLQLSINGTEIAIVASCRFELHCQWHQTRH